MEQRLSLITLGISDLDRARDASTRRSAGRRAPSRPTTSSSSRPAGWWSRLWDRAKLAEDSAVTDGGGWGGVTLAYNTRSTEEVDEVIEEARAAGATIGREPAETFWGGYSGVFIDPDGYPWEVAHNPRWTIEEDGSVTIPTD